MCLGVPGKLIERWLDTETQVPMARVDYGGVSKEICLAFEPDAQINEYVMVHVGFAISRIDEAEALQTLALLQQMGDLAEELGLDTPPTPLVPVLPRATPNTGENAMSTIREGGIREISG